MKPDIPSQKEVNKEIHVHMIRAWNRYRKNALQWLPEECEHMREGVEEVIAQAFYQGGLAAGNAFAAILEKHLKSKKPTGSPAPSPQDRAG